MSSPAGFTVLKAPASAANARVSALRILALEAQAEWLRLMRAPAFCVPVLGFPILFYLLFGVALAPRQGGAEVGRATLAMFTVFGVMAPGLFGMGVTLAMDRDRGLLALKRALPMPPGVYLAAKLLVSVLFAVLAASLLAGLAVTVGHAALAFFEVCELLVLAALGVLPFCGLGLLIGTLVKGQAAAAVINLVYLPMSFLSGVLLPLAILPRFLAHLAPFWPAYHLAQLALAVAGARGMAAGGAGGHVLTLGGMTLVFFAIARARLRRRG